MILYLLKVIACSGLFYGFYFFFLQKEKMLVFNRFYLLGAVLVSTLIPMIRFTIWVPSTLALPAAEIASYAPVAASTGNALLLYTLEQISLPIMIATGSLYFLFRFLKSLVRLHRIAKQAEPLVWNQTAIRLHPYAMSPYSAAGKIFLNKTEWEAGSVEEEVLLHEKAHICQKHFYDVLFMELMQLFFWFNPFVYLFKKAVKLNHEYLADTAVVMALAAKSQMQEVVRAGRSAPGNPLALAEASVAYQQLLLQKVYVNQSIQLASSFYFSTTKKRLLMLQRKTSFLIAVGKAAMILPLTGGLVFLFAGRTYAQKEKPVIISTTVTEVRRDNRQSGDVESLTVTTSKDKKQRTAVLQYRNGTVIRDDVSTKNKAMIFEQQYGVTLNPPPPLPAPAPVPPPPIPSDVLSAPVATVIDQHKIKIGDINSEAPLSVPQPDNIPDGIPPVQPPPPVLVRERAAPRRSADVALPVPATSAAEPRILETKRQ